MLHFLGVRTEKFRKNMQNSPVSVLESHSEPASTTIFKNVLEIFILLQILEFAGMNIEIIHL